MVIYTRWNVADPLSTRTCLFTLQMQRNIKLDWTALVKYVEKVCDLCVLESFILIIFKYLLVFKVFKPA